MGTPRIVAEYTDDEGNKVSIVWVNLGKYEIWLNKRCVEELNHDGVIKYLADKLKMTTTD